MQRPCYDAVTGDIVMCSIDVEEILTRRIQGEKETKRQESRGRTEVSNQCTWEAEEDR